ncbi:MAG: PAS domain S-box protein [Pirellulales bacterium]|nr:PAS domain S-box protein [Pirellulales bacterium]
MSETREKIESADESERTKVSQQRRLAEVLAENEKLTALVASIQDEVWFADTQKRFTLANPAALRAFTLGSSGDVDIEKLAADLEVFRPDGSPRPVEESPPLRALNGEVITNQEEIIRSPASGELRYRQVSSAPVKDVNGNIIGSVSVVRDITEQKRVEEALRQSQKDLSRAQAVGQIGSWRLALREDILTWSEENYRIFGVPEGTPMNYEGFLNIVHPDDRKYVDDKWQAALRGEEYDIEHRIVAHGSVRWVREKAFLEFDDGGELLSGFGITQDITDRKQTEEELRRFNETLEARVAERTALAQRRAHDLRRLAAELNEAEHRERKRLANLLHDDLQQLLLAVRLRLPLIVKADPDQLPRHCEQLDELIDECIRTSRNLTHELSPPVIQHGTLTDILEWLSEWFAEKYGLVVIVKTRNVTCNEPRDGASHVPEHLRVFLFQAVRELLFNVVKHSGTMKSRVTLSRQHDSLSIEVEDEGYGFDPKAVEACLQAPRGFGLFHIKERLDAMRAKLEIKATPRGGGCFKMIIPLDNEAGDSS